MFVPHILAVQQGTTVEFQNSDTVQHNAFWTAISGDKKAGHNLGTWPKGEKRPFTFAKAGVVPVLCNVHPEMTGYVIVSPTPYFAETDDGGNYKIKDVPDGSYTVTAWHVRILAVEQNLLLQGQPKVRRIAAQCLAKKSRRRNSNQRDRLSLHGECGPDNVRV